MIIKSHVFSLSFIPRFNMQTYHFCQKGSLNTENFKVFILNQDQEYVSSVHDIPLWHNESEAIANMVVEVPRWTHAKLEISAKDPLNPIKHVNKMARNFGAKKCKQSQIVRRFGIT